MSNERAGTLKIIGSAKFIEQLLDDLEASYEVLQTSPVIENDNNDKRHRFVSLLRVK